MVSGRATLLAAVERGDIEEIERLAVSERRTIRTLLGLTYRDDPAVRELAARGLAAASRQHPVQVTEVARRLVWAMNDESGTNAPHAPEVIRRLAECAPRLLVPLLPDLLRLTGDPGLRDELVAAVRRVAEQLPGESARAVGDGLGRCVEGGKRHGV